MSWAFIGKIEARGVGNLTLKTGEVVMRRGSQLLTTARVSTKLNLWIVGIGPGAKGARGVEVVTCRFAGESVDLDESDEIGADRDQRESWMVKGKSVVDVHQKDQGTQCRRNDIENGRWDMCNARQVAICRK